MAELRHAQFTGHRFVVADISGNVFSRFATRAEADEAAKQKALGEVFRDFFVVEMKPLRAVLAERRTELSEMELDA